MSNRSDWFCLVPVVMGIAIYSNTFGVPFIFDDFYSIVQNSAIQDLGLFLSEEGYEYNPRRFVGYLTLALNYHFGGLNVAGYHAVNLAIHIANSLLVFALARLTFRTPYLKGQVEDSGLGSGDPRSSFVLHPSLFIPLFAALLFIVHPVQTQAVTYIVQRLASLATMFYLLSLVLYILARLRFESRVQGHESQNSNDFGPGTRDSRPALHRMAPVLLLAGSVLSAVMAMKTKEIAFTLPFIVLLYELSFFQGPWKKRLPYLLPVLMTAVIVPFSILSSGESAGEAVSDVGEQLRAGTQMSRWDYLFTQFRVIVTYLRLLVLPIHQNLDYDYPVYSSFFAAPVFLSFLLLASLVAVAIYFYWRTRLPSQQPLSFEARLAGFGILWFFLTLSVESSIIPIEDVIYEHRLYLPSVGIFLSFAGMAYGIGRRFKRNLLIPCFSLLILVLCFATWTRNGVWTDETIFWQDVIKKSPQKSRPYNNLGYSLLAAGKPLEAIGPLQESIRLKPDYAYAHNNIGVAYLQNGLPEKALRHFEAAVEFRPQMPDAYYNMGDAYKAMGRYQECIESYLKSIEKRPKYSFAYNNLGIAYAEMGQLELALKYFELAVTYNKNNISARNNLDRAKRELGIFQ